MYLREHLEKEFGKEVIGYYTENQIKCHEMNIIEFCTAYILDLVPVWPLDSVIRKKDCISRLVIENFPEIMEISDEQIENIFTILPLSIIYLFEVNGILQESFEKTKKWIVEKS